MMEYLIINNIPYNYHSSDLRNFFSQFIETSGFDCFHFRHRPEVQKPRCTSSALNSPSSTTAVREKRRTCCCVIRAKKERVLELMSSYHEKHWIDRKGETMPTKCFISRVKVVAAQPTYKADSRNTAPCDHETLAVGVVVERAFTADDINNLIELHPPLVMPHGNVGTPTSVFLELIRACRLPPIIITKLGLEFPRSRSARLYSSVQYDYGGKATRFLSNWHAPQRIDQEIVRTANGNIISRSYVPSEKQTRDAENDDDDKEALKEESDEEDNDCEEWERHESLHDDVTQQERLKERLFEEKIELKWEKGGSGLVFYTDAKYWDEREGDFDEKTANDWDVDTSIYYDQKNGGDKDARDLLQMRAEKRLRHGTDEEDPNWARIGLFESHTKGIGRKVLEKHGWKEGEGLGRSIRGIAEPIEDAGQHPRDKRGLGFRGDKLDHNCFTKSKKRRSSPCGVVISTVYDDPREVDPEEALLRSGLLTKLSYRKEFLRSKDGAEGC